MTAALLAIFLQNAVFEKVLGINVLLYASRRKEHFAIFGGGLCYVTSLSCAAAWCFDEFFGGNEYYRLYAPVIYIAIIGIIYIVTKILVWRFLPKLFRQIRKIAHLIVFNCAVLGAMFINSQSGGSVWSYIGYGLGTAAGFFAAAALLYIAHARLNSSLVPAAFRGMPIMVVYVGILAMAFHAFLGYAV